MQEGRKAPYTCAQAPCLISTLRHTLGTMALCMLCAGIQQAKIHSCRRLQTAQLACGPEIMYIRAHAPMYIEVEMPSSEKATRAGCVLAC